MSVRKYGHAPSSGVNVAYFSLGLLLPCDAFLTASLSTLIVAGLAHPKDGNTGAMPSLYLHFHVEDCLFEIGRD